MIGELQKASTRMALFPLNDAPGWNPPGEMNPVARMHETSHRKQIVSGVLLVIILFQLVNLPGALLMKSPIDIGTVFLGLALCGVAALFNQLGKITVVGIMLIAVIDLGCGLMLLTSPMGLDVSDLPVFDVLLVSLLIAVSLLPAISVFPVALSNILFIIAVITLKPHTMDMTMLLTSNMAYNTLVQPVSLQIVVAVVAYIWVRSALRAIARAERAEEIVRLQQRETELLWREAERTQQLALGSEQLLQILVRASNGDYTVRANLSQDHLLWRVGNALNVLLSRLRRISHAEQEIVQLQNVNARLNQLIFEANKHSQYTPPPSAAQANPMWEAQAPREGRTSSQWSRQAN